MYVVVTSDGVVHETRSVARYVALLDEYGPEVVDSSEPVDANPHDVLAAIVVQYAQPNPRPNGTIYP